MFNREKASKYTSQCATWGWCCHHHVLAEHPLHFPDQVPGVVPHQGVGLTGSSGASTHPSVPSESGETPSSTTLHRLIPRSITSPKLCLVQCFFLISNNVTSLSSLGWFPFSPIRTIQHQDKNFCKNSRVLNNFLTELPRSKVKLAPYIFIGSNSILLFFKKLDGISNQK